MTYLSKRLDLHQYPARLIRRHAVSEADSGVSRNLAALNKVRVGYGGVGCTSVAGNCGHGPILRGLSLGILEAGPESRTVGGLNQVHARLAGNLELEALTNPSL